MSRVYLIDRSDIGVNATDLRFRTVDNNSISYQLPVVSVGCTSKEVKLRPVFLDTKCCQPGYMNKQTLPAGYKFDSKDYPWHKVYLNTRLNKYKLSVDPRDTYY